MGYLDELKRQADEARARNSVDLAALERNSLVTDGACNAAFRYLASLAQQLNVLQPVSKAAYRFDAKNTFRNLKMSNFRCDSRQRRNRNAEVFDHVVLGFDLKTGTGSRSPRTSRPRSTSSRPASPSAAPSTRARTWSIRRTAASSRSASSSRPTSAASSACCRTTTPPGSSSRSSTSRASRRCRCTFPAFEVGSQRLDELARWIVGEPNGFLRGGENLRRVEY